MKVAQLLATVPGGLPDEYAEALGALQSQAPAMGWGFVKRRMAAELGPDWRGAFADFEAEAAAAASLGQVHRATAHDGALLACKLQYPDMASAVAADIRQLKLIFAIYARYDRAIDTGQIHAEIAARLREELDYEREARHMVLYGAMLGDEPGVHVPTVETGLSTKRLLTMSWLDGAPLLDFKEAPAERRNDIARHMFNAWYVPFYRYGVLHGDPHLGNYTVRPDGSVNVLDYGCIRVFGSRFVRGVIDLYHAVRDEDRDLAVHAYETWGFSGLSHDMVEALGIWTDYIYGPLIDDRTRLIDESGSGGLGGAVAAKVHREIRRLGGVTPAARVRADGPLGDRPRLGLPAPQGRAQLASALRGLDRGFRRGRAGAPPGRCARALRRARGRLKLPEQPCDAARSAALPKPLRKRERGLGKPQRARHCGAAAGRAESMQA